MTVRPTHATTSSDTGRAPRRRWPLERVLFALAGAVTLASILLAATTTPWFLLLTGFVGVSQLAYVTFGACPASIVLERGFGIDRGCAR